MEISDWIEHRRHDGELVGWMRPDGESFVPVDLLGRDVSGPTDWLSAEEALDERGLGFLAEPYLLELENGERTRVRIAEVDVRSIRLLGDEFGAASAVGAPRIEYTLAWPAPPELRPLR